LSAEGIIVFTCIIKGFKFIRGQSFGTETEECESDSAYCYNITAEAAVLINVMKAAVQFMGTWMARKSDGDFIDASADNSRFIGE
uniref:Uncharacterized protein n=1 Tax=Parascaris equorum TaxID=6256 RepID=A0A914RB36_PAREQ